MARQIIAWTFIGHHWCRGLCWRTREVLGLLEWKQVSPAAVWLQRFSYFSSFSYKLCKAYDYLDLRESFSDKRYIIEFRVDAVSAGRFLTLRLSQECAKQKVCQCKSIMIVPEADTSVLNRWSKAASCITNVAGKTLFSKIIFNFYVSTQHPQCVSPVLE